MGNAQTARAAQGAGARQELLARLAAKQPMRDTREIVVDPGPVEELERARAARETAVLFTETDPAGVAKADAALRAAEKAAVGCTVTLVFQALGRDVWDALLTAHPPTEQNREAGHAYDADSFLPALVAATVLEEPTGPMLSLADLEKVLAAGPDGVLPGRLFSTADVLAVTGDWNAAEWQDVCGAAVRVCQSIRNPALPFGSAPMRS